jgi:hypothetical protein
MLFIVGRKKTTWNDALSRDDALLRPGCSKDRGRGFSRNDIADESMVREAALNLGQLYAADELTQKKAAAK